MIKIKFKQISEKKIFIIGTDIKGEEKEIGHIFTPSGSGGGNVNAIQICGFDEAFDLWGCGVFGDKATGKMKKDIQLIWFNNYNMMSNEERNKIKVGEKIRPVNEKEKKSLGLDTDFYTEIITKNRFDIEGTGACMQCFNYPCTCEIKTRYENPYTVKREQDVNPITQKNYDEAVKNAILNSLEK